MDLVVTQSMLKPANGSSNNFTNERNVFNRKKLNNSKDSSFNENQAKISEDLTSQLSVEDYKKRLQAIHNLIQAANLKLNLYINNENIKKTAPVTVQIYLIFLRVGEIDNVKERFQADAYFEASWEDDSVDANLAFDPRSNWEPEIYIENAVGNLKQEIKYRVERDGDKTRIFEMRNIKGIFWEKLELWDFPLERLD
ncbi:expressed conserved [Brachionus plicatilis]|uniref:Expressed conserved n=1 Tax=Brachionus plicatilis TaxID=10195 RepID=A0A3M7RI96_BRAPC|nr:expressed conserved [Brachionus plicatilis]